MLKEFRGHVSYVNNAIFSTDGTRVITASSDYTVKVRISCISSCTIYSVENYHLFIFSLSYLLFCIVYNLLHIHLWFLNVGMGFQNNRLFANIQDSSSFEGN